MEFGISGVIEQLASLLHVLGVPDDARNMVVAMARYHASAPTRPAPPSDADIARDFLRSSIRRTECFGPRIVADTSWNMLLDLFAAEENDQAVSISSLCIASGSPPTTALRHIDWLVEQRCVIRRDDPFDGRRTWIQPTPATMDLMRSLIRSFCVERLPEPLPLPDCARH